MALTVGTRALALVQGDTGVGKTVLLQSLWMQVAEEWLNGTGRDIPLFVDLRILADVRLHGRSARNMFSAYAEAHRKFRGMLMDYLQNEHGLRLFWDDLRAMCRNGHILFILDGLDEMSQDGRNESVRTHLTLLRDLADSGGRVVISCRSHYLRSDEECFGLIAEAGLPWPKALVLDVMPFDTHGIDQYISARLSPDRRSMWRRIKESRTLGASELSRRPFLLNTLIDCLNDVNAESGPFRETLVFDRYLKSWLARDRWRFEQFLEDFNSSIQRDLASMRSAELSPRADPRTDLDGWSEELLTRFIEGLALEMTLSQRHSFTPDEIADYLRTRLPSLPEIFLSFFEYAIRTCSFLSRDAVGNYAFLHESLMAYFAAAAMRRELTIKVYPWDESASRGLPQLKAIPYSLGLRPLGTEVKAFLMSAREVIDGQSIGVSDGLLLRWHGGRSTGGLF